MQDGIKENDSGEKANELYEIINPSDPYTFRAIDDKVALAVCLLAGRGKTPGKRVGDGEDIGGLLMFMSDEESEKFFKDTFGDFGEWLKENNAEVVKALESVLCMPAGERYSYERAIELMPDDETRKKYRDEIHDRLRTSLNDFGSYCWSLAESFRKAAAEAKLIPPYKDCESESGCRCVIDGGKSKAVMDERTCEPCTKQNGEKKEIEDANNKRDDE